ncbi:Conserved_hypothetical protein [Hexamita inflata]|uniref:Transmembrane protein n=1 Tax=Hexamita inflata TaxID=28002 RepID=A0AA86QHD5_9EUKA|nr:Conserved hypothetical protein [Hexamita inflata]
MQYGYKYKINNSKYWRVQYVCQQIIFTCSVICVISISIIYGLTGLTKEYKCMHELSECEKECVLALESQYVPFAAFFNASIISAMPLIETFNLYPSPNHIFKMCKSLNIQTESVKFIMSIEAGLIDKELYLQRFPTTGNNYLTINFKKNSSILVDTNYVQTTNNKIQIQIPENGAFVSTMYASHIDSIEIPKYEFNNCVPFHAAELKNYQYVVAELIQNKETYEAVHFNFIGLDITYQTSDYVFWALYIVSGLMIIETTIYFIFQCKKKTEKKKNKSDLLIYINQKREEFE